MNVVLFLYLVFLFVVFTPRVVFNLPFKTTRFYELTIYALLFALAWTVTHKLVWRMTTHEGLRGKNNAKAPSAETVSTTSPFSLNSILKSTGKREKGTKAMNTTMGVPLNTLSNSAPSAASGDKKKGKGGKNK